jgi:hypothetical protein
MEIPFTEYVLPHGRRAIVNFLVPKDKENEAKKLLELGYEFSCEKLRTGDAVLYSNKKNLEDETTTTALIIMSDKQYTREEIIKKLLDGFSQLIDRTTADIGVHSNYTVGSR